MKLLSYLLGGALILSPVAMLVTYVWTHDLRWLATAIIVGGCIALFASMATVTVETKDEDQ